MRKVELSRKTAETDVKLAINLDGDGKSVVNTGSGFLDHMLTLFAAHGKFDLEVTCIGDVYVDYHHTTEDIGITLGDAFKAALGDKRGINRYGDTLLPMDEALIFTAVDFSGRSFLGFEVEFLTEKIGDFDVELVEEFWQGFVRRAECALHVREMAGKNSHHVAEGIFKSAARSLKKAVEIDEKYASVIPSTKGVL